MSLKLWQCTLCHCIFKVYFFFFTVSNKWKNTYKMLLWGVGGGCDLLLFYRISTLHRAEYTKDGKPFTSACHNMSLRECMDI